MWGTRSGDESERDIGGGRGSEGGETIGEVGKRAADRQTGASVALSWL